MLQLGALYFTGDSDVSHHHFWWVNYRATCALLPSYVDCWAKGFIDHGSIMMFVETQRVWSLLYVLISGSIPKVHLRPPIHEKKYQGYLNVHRLSYIYWLVVWNMFSFFHILGMSSSQLIHIFRRGRSTTNQIIINHH